MGKYFFQLLLAVCLSFFSVLAEAQISVNPEFPTDTESAVITFDATQGSGGLEGYTGDVYVHTGVLTNLSNQTSDWRYVKTDWGENTSETKMTRIDDDLYEIQIGPSIREYYGVPSSETIEKMAFVFRSEDSGNEGKGEGGSDLLVNVYEAGLAIKIDNPKKDAIIDPGSTIEITATSSETAALKLILDGAVLKESTGTSISATFTFNSTGGSFIVATATKDLETVNDSTQVYVRGEVVSEPLPPGYLRGINYPDDQSAALVLYAPGKSFVYVLGDFNDWLLQSAYQMKKDGDFFWLEIQGLEAEKPYVFQYYIDGEIKIADPYADQVSDPWHDKNISSITYPNLVKYPENKAEGIASVITTGQNAYNWEVPDFNAEENEKLIFYELLIRDFTEEHSYKGVRNQLDYLQELGVNAVELMPFNEFEGNSSWGYNPSFYFAPDKYYGPGTELKKLVDECHKRGMAVIMDMVLNHSYGQSPLVQMYWDEVNERPSANNPWYNPEHNFKNPDAQWGYDFNHESRETEILVDSITSYWMNEYKIDGFRFDFTKGFSNTIYPENSWGSAYDDPRISNLKRISDAIWEENPNAIVVFEHLSDNTEESLLADHGILLWGNMNANYAEAAMGYHDSGKSDLSWGIYENRFWSKPHLITYMESHDEERIAFKCGAYGNSLGSYSIKDTITYLNRLKLSSFFLIPLPGPKMIWQFGELGYDYSIDYNGRTGEKPVRWDYYNEPRRKDVYMFYKTLIKLKGEIDVFSPDNGLYDLESEIKTYQLNRGSDYILAVGNFGVEEQEITLNFPEPGTWYDFFTDSEFSVEGTNHKFKLKQGGYKLFSDFKIEGFDDLVTDVEDSAIPDYAVQVYPNPSNDFLYVNADSYIHAVEIMDLQGRIFSCNQIQDQGTSQFDIRSLKTGFYLLKITGKDGWIITSRFLKKK